MAQMVPLTPDDVQKALAALGLDAGIRFFSESTATSQLAAEQIGCQLGQIAKSLAFIVDASPILVIASGDRRVDTRKLAALYGVGRKKIKVATPEQCVAIYGYAPGGVPPVGHRQANLPIWLDHALQRYTQLYAAGGAHNAIFPITLAQLATVTGGQFADLAEAPEPPPAPQT